MLKSILRLVIEKLRQLLEPKVKRQPVVAGSLRCTSPVYDEPQAKFPRGVYCLHDRTLLSTFLRPWGRRRGFLAEE